MSLIIYLEIPSQFIDENYPLTSVFDMKLQYLYKLSRERRKEKVLKYKIMKTAEINKKNHQDKVLLKLKCPIYKIPFFKMCL